MLLGYSFEPRPNSRALGTAGSVMTIGLFNKQAHSKKPVYREKTRSTFLVPTQEEDRKGLCSQGVVGRVSQQTGGCVSLRSLILCFY